jgi:hypothetical protein
VPEPHPRHAARAGRDVLDFLKIGNAVMRPGSSTVRLGVAKTGRVQVSIYDVAGRKVRNLADRVFPAGEHDAAVGRHGRRRRQGGRGVYFVRTSNDKQRAAVIVLNR